MKTKQIIFYSIGIFLIWFLANKARQTAKPVMEITKRPEDSAALRTLTAK